MSDNTDLKSIEIMKRCPRFHKCSVPVCPLDRGQDHRTRLPHEPKCTLAKSIRRRIGQNTTLPEQGLTKQEWAARQRWESLSESEKQRRSTILRQLLLNHKGSSNRKGKTCGGMPMPLRVPDKQTEIQR